ncbi:hypothetical protein AGR1C_Lc10036 [Agrobacterium fabacearum TT111]|nr:hypothetical protein AGR1C_Lc10036 [Agrobacterium fabacearum TT111]
MLGEEVDNTRKGASLVQLCNMIRCGEK